MRGPEGYSREYLLRACGGHMEFVRSGGREMSLVHEHALDLAELAPGLRVLDLGTGRGEVAFQAALRGCEVEATDFSQDAVDLATEVARQLPAGAGSMRVTRGDATEPAFGDGTFDRVLMLDLVEHLPPEALAKSIAAARRLLRGDGRLVVHTTPSREFMAFGQHAWRLLQRSRGRPVPPILTYASEAELAGHCNIQSVASMHRSLRVFAHHRVMTDFTHQSGPIKALLAGAGMSRFLSRNLWGLASDSQLPR
ncbi:MAG: class I SAM-dependent methyltransferase [Candidatus Dormibacteria bacterium]